MSDLNATVDAGQSTTDVGDQQQAGVQQSVVVDTPPDRSNAVWDDMLKDRHKAKEKARSATKENAELRAQLESIEKEKAERLGLHKERADKLEVKYNDLHRVFLKSQVQLGVSSALVDAGCIDQELALTAGRSEFLEFDEATGKVDGVDTWLQDLKERKPVLFGPVKTPTVNPSVPGGGVKATSTVPGDDYSLMSTDQIKAELKRVGDLMKGQ